MPAAQPSVSVQPSAVSQLVRLGTVPQFEPPYDDDSKPPSRRRPKVARKPRPFVLPARPPERRPTVDSPARDAIRRFVGATVEVLNGFRPANHLRPLLDPVAAQEIIDDLSRRTVPTDLRRPRSNAVDDRVRVRQIRICEPIAGVAEAAVVLGHGEHRWAIALRWEYLRGAWLCTVALVI